MDLSAAIQLIQSTAIKADGAQLLEVSPDGRTAHYSQQGKAFTIDRGAPPRSHQVETVADLIDFVASYAGDSSIWHNDAGVALLCDHEDRRDSVLCRLSHGEAFTALASGKGQYTQPEFVRLLNRTLGLDAATVAIFRRLDFKVIQAAEGDIQHGKERLGKSINAEVKGTSDIPETIDVTCAVYSNQGERNPRTIRCGVDLDPQRGVILFAPLPEELLIAIEGAQADIRGRIVEELPDVKVYAGTP